MCDNFQEYQSLVNDKISSRVVKKELDFVELRKECEERERKFLESLEGNGIKTLENVLNEVSLTGQMLETNMCKHPEMEFESIRENVEHFYGNILKKNRSIDKEICELTQIHRSFSRTHASIDFGVSMSTFWKANLVLIDRLL